MHRKRDKMKESENKQYLIKLWFFKDSMLPKKELREQIISEFKPILGDALENVEIEEPADGKNTKEKESTFILDENTASICLYEIMSSSFCNYEGDREFLKNTSEFKCADLLHITEDDWKDIARPWNSVKPYMDSYFKILNQAPKKWFKEGK